MLFDQLVTGAHVSGSHLFLRREAVLDDLKYPVKARQGKHQHDHPADPRRFNKLFIAAGKIVQVFPIAFRFRMLLAANRHVQFGGGFTRQNLAQPLDQRAGQRRVNHKIGAGEAKNDTGFGMRRQASIDKQFAFICTMDWQKKRQRGHRRNQFAYQPGCLIAVKKFIRHL